MEQWKESVLMTTLFTQQVKINACVAKVETETLLKLMPIKAFGLLTGKYRII